MRIAEGSYFFLLTNLFFRSGKNLKVLVGGPRAETQHLDYIATLCLDHQSTMAIAVGFYLFSSNQHLFSKKLKVTNKTRENLTLLPRLATLCLNHVTNMTIAGGYCYFFYLILFSRSGKNLKVLTSQAGIDPNHLDWQYSAITTTPPRLLLGRSFFLLTNPFLPLWKEAKSTH